MAMLWTCSNFELLLAGMHCSSQFLRGRNHKPVSAWDLSKWCEASFTLRTCTRVHVRRRACMCVHARARCNGTRWFLWRLSHCTPSAHTAGTSPTHKSNSARVVRGVATFLLPLHAVSRSTTQYQHSLALLRATAATCVNGRPRACTYDHARRTSCVHARGPACVHARARAQCEWGLTAGDWCWPVLTI